MTRISILLIFTLLFILVAGEEESVSGGDVEVSRLIRSPERKKNQRQRNKKKKKTSRSKKKTRGQEKKRTGKKKTRKEKKKSKNENKKKKRGSRKRSRNGGGGKCGRQSGADDSTCLANIGTVYDYIATQITNFEKQKKNVDRFKDIMTRKGGKKDNFANSTSFISSACTGNTEASSNLATLNNCSTSINSGCTLPTVDEDTLASCQTSFDGVETKNDECYQQMIAESADLSAACTCYAEAAKLVEDTKALKCSAVDEFNKLRDAKNECLDKFKACKKAEDASVGLIHVCNGGTTPATTTAASTTTTTEVPVSTTTAAGGAATTTTAAVTTAAGGGSTSGCRCGVKKSTRIVGGTEVNPINKYPWMVAITDANGNQFCGGTLVASKYVVTAAHCMFKDTQGTQAWTAAEIRIRIGDHDLSATGETSLTEKTVTVTTITNHESYSAASAALTNDITVLTLGEDLDLNTYTPACLAKTTDATTFDNKVAQVYGWGTTSFGGASSSKLLEVNVTVVTKAVCEAAMGPMGDGQICAGGEEGKDSCQGDSGGPLTVEIDGQHILIGDVSYGDGCAKAGKYGVYGRISFYRTWIESKMSSPTFCANGGANQG